MIAAASDKFHAAIRASYWYDNSFLFSLLSPSSLRVCMATFVRAVFLANSNCQKPLATTLAKTDQTVQGHKFFSSLVKDS
jgi:hypothetical protein